MIGLGSDKNQQLFKIFHPGSAASTGPVGRGGKKTVRTVLVFHRSGNVHVNSKKNQVQAHFEKPFYWLKRTHGFFSFHKDRNLNLSQKIFALRSSLNIPEIFLKQLN